MEGRRKVLGLVAWLVMSLVAARLNAIFPPGEWFTSLAKPSWTPPGAVIGPVWVALYILMAVSAWLVWKGGHPGRRRALAVYVVQLLFNAAWSWLFFGLHMMAAAFVEITVLWLLILATIVVFRPISRAAAILLVPYLAWVAFASALTFSIWRLNT